MAKFKKGDRVRVLRTDYEDVIPVGTTTHVVEAYCTGGADLWCEDFPEGLYFSEYELEPIAPAPTFQVGDRVRAIADSPRGEVGRIHSIDDDYGHTSYLVEFDTWRGGHEGDNNFPDDRGWYLSAWKLERLPLTITAGRRYKTRTGIVVGPMEIDDIGFLGYVDGYGRIFDGAGGHVFGDSELDLVEEVSAPALKIEAGKYYRTRDGRKVGPMEYRGDYDGEHPWVGDVSDGAVYIFEKNGTNYIPGANDLVAEWADFFAVAPATPATPAIVARLDNGQPRPSTAPYVHADRASAEREAARLASANPGKEFAVYEFVSSVKETKVYMHEWQRLAAGGDADEAARKLRTEAGIPLMSARNAVDYWLTVAA